MWIRVEGTAAVNLADCNLISVHPTTDENTGAELWVCCAERKDGSHLAIRVCSEREEAVGVCDDIISRLVD